MDRVVARIWSALTSRRLAAGLGLVLATMWVASFVSEQVSLDEGTSIESLRAALPGVFGVQDLRHGLVFVSAGIGLAAVLVLMAADLLLSRQPVRGRLVAGVFLRLATAATLVLLLAHLFLAREVVVPLVPEETVLLPSLDASIRARVTGWRPTEGAFGTVEVARRLAGSELAGPFGDQDRAPGAALAVDSTESELSAGEPGTSQGLVVRLAEVPSAWAARVRVTWQGIDALSPYLESAQTWRVAALPLDPTPVITVDRVAPAFDPSVPAGSLPPGGPPVNPAAIVTLHRGEEVLGSRALAPGESVVLGDTVVALDGFAPVLEASVSRSPYDRLPGWIVACAALATLSGAVLVAGGIVSLRRSA